MTSARLERASKLLLLAWTCVALAAAVYWNAPAWRALVPWSAGAFLVAFAVAAFDRRAMAAILTTTYVYPALIYLLSGRREVQFGALWMCALVGAMAPDALRTPWHIRRPWRAPLVAWALVVAAAATIVALREFDFTWALLSVRDVPNSSIGGWPSYVVSWSLTVALTLVVGILWLDWISRFSLAEFRRLVALPLFIGFLASAAISLWQAAVDVRFLNPTVYGNIHRAAGGALDANVAGVVSALWIGASVMYASALPRRRGLVASVGAAAGWTAMWASGSRTSLMLAVLVTAAWAFAAWRRPAGRTWAVLAGGAAAVLLLLSLSGAGANVVGPLARLRPGLPEPTVASVRQFAQDMWDRNGYGRASARMIREYPLFGVGVGFFHVMFPDYAALTGVAHRVPDNAQNWFRHQLAEFGLVGSLPWLIWVGMVAVLLWRRPRGSPAVAWLTRGMLLGLALVSMVGMPGQALMVALTFWMVVAWYALVEAPPANAPALSGREWAAIATVVVVFSAGTAALAVGPLRVPARAQRIGWPYMYGFYAPERTPDGDEFRWTARHAVAVIPARTHHLDLAISANHPDLAAHPIDATVWIDGVRVAQARLRDATPVVNTVTLPDQERWVRVEIRASRTERPSDAGSTDTRDLGVIARWRFTPDP